MLIASPSSAPKSSHRLSATIGQYSHLKTSRTLFLYEHYMPRCLRHRLRLRPPNLLHVNKQYLATATSIPTCYFFEIMRPLSTHYRLVGHCDFSHLTPIQPRCLFEHSSVKIDGPRNPNFGFPPMLEPNLEDVSDT